MQPNKPPDADQRMARVALALDGLSVGDALGQIDTNCAIVGGIVALAVGREAIPRPWLDSREDLV